MSGQILSRKQKGVGFLSPLKDGGSSPKNLMKHFLKLTLLFLMAVLFSGRGNAKQPVCQIPPFFPSEERILTRTVPSIFQA